MIYNVLSQTSDTRVKLNYGYFSIGGVRFCNTSGGPCTDITHGTEALKNSVVSSDNKATIKDGYNSKIMPKDEQVTSNWSYLDYITFATKTDYRLISSYNGSNGGHLEKTVIWDYVLRKTDEIYNENMRNDGKSPSKEYISRVLWNHRPNREDSIERTEFKGTLVNEVIITRPEMDNSSVNKIINPSISNSKETPTQYVADLIYTQPMNCIYDEGDDILILVIGVFYLLGFLFIWICSSLSKG